MNSKPALSPELAYSAMFCFLESQYEQTSDGGIGALLGSLMVLEDGMPADQGAWEEWLEAIDKARARSLNEDQ